MKKTFLALLILVSISVVFSAEGFASSGFYEEVLVYEQDFDSVEVGTVPEEMTTSNAAAFSESGYMHVIEKKAGGADRAFRINHQTTAKGTNSATIALPTPVYGGFKLEADFKFGQTVKKEFTVFLPDNKTEIFRIVIDSGKTRLSSTVNKVTTLLADMDFDIDYRVEYHLTFDLNPLNQSVVLTVDGDGYHKSTVIDVSSAGIAEEQMGIGSMKLSTYYKSAVSSTNRFFQIDNIELRTKSHMVTFDGNNNDTEPSGNTEIDVNVSMLNNTSACPQLLFVMYDSEGKVVNVTADKIADGSLPYTKKLTFDEPVPANSRLRVFVWNDISGLRPLGAAAEF